MTHYPRPWHIEPFEKTYDAEQPIGLRIVAADGRIVADNEPYYPHALDPDNAPLLTASPCLLEAANAVWEEANPYHGEAYGDAVPPSYYLVPRNAMLELVAQINRAEDSPPSQESLKPDAL